MPVAVAGVMGAMGLRPAADAGSPLWVGVAFSGGADSVALLASLREAGFDCVALHCHFGLRGAESDRDAAFARSMAARLGARFEIVRFDVGARRRHTGESVEMACRSLRYDWFRRMARDLGLGCVAVGHHREDNRETFFLNLLRGTGIKGLAGMPRRRGLYVRPLLDVTRPEIERYLCARGLDWVTDSTNLEDDFLRNRLRLRLLPDVESLFPGSLAQVDKTISNLRSDSGLLAALVAEKAAAYHRDGCWLVGRMLATQECGAALLRHCLTGFHPEVAAQVAMAASHGESGRVFCDKSGGEWLLDRGVLQPYLREFTGDVCVFTLDDMSSIPPEIDVVRLPRSEFSPTRDASVLWLDADAVAHLTLSWRHPKPGDRIQPFGMKGSRLLSDIYSDHHLSLTDKQRQRVLACGDTVLWAAGLRASRHFPVTAATEEVYKLTLRPRH